MGAGKTTVGRVLANALGWQFMDLDEEIENRHRQGVRDIFRLHGEAHFRQVETLALRDCLDGIPLSTVIALGGGTFIQPRNVELLRLASVHVVFLEASAEELFDRCRNTVSPEENVRPLAADPDAFFALYEQRLPLYRTAHLTVYTTAKSTEEIAREIAAAVRLVAEIR